MLKIKNGYITVEISELGAEIKRITVNSRERLWNGDNRYWSSTSPVLFPICGGLKDDKYTYGGKEYTLEKHGFAKSSDFSIKKLSENSATLSLSSDEETLKKYPWNFIFDVTFTLNELSLNVKYTVKNVSDNDLYMSLGAHEGYFCEGGIENYEIIFSEKENIDTYTVTDGLMDGGKTPILRDSNILRLSYDYFKIDALIFKDLKSRSAVLHNRVTDENIKLDFDGFDYFLIWTKPDAEYICLEPWTGICDTIGTEYDIKTKEGITAVKPNDTFSVTHKISF